LPSVAALFGADSFKFVSRSVAARKLKAQAFGRGYLHVDAIMDSTYFAFDGMRWIGAKYVGFEVADDEARDIHSVPFNVWVSLPNNFQINCFPTNQKAENGSYRYGVVWSRTAAGPGQEGKGTCYLGLGEWVPIGADSSGVVSGSFGEVMVEAEPASTLHISFKGHHLATRIFASDREREGLETWIQRH
jgi:hypothetical protein